MMNTLRFLVPGFLFLYKFPLEFTAEVENYFFL